MEVIAMLAVQVMVMLREVPVLRGPKLRGLQVSGLADGVPYPYLNQLKLL